MAVPEKILFSQRVSVPEAVLFQEMLDAAAVLLNLDTQSYFGLDPVGTRMWTRLTESSSIQKAYESLLDDYAVEAEQLRSDLIGLIHQFVDNGLVVLDHAEVE